MKHFYLKTRNVATTLLLLALFVVGVSPATAQKSLPYSYGFENNNLAAEGWTTASTHSSTGISNTAKNTGSYSFRFYFNCNPPQYLISPELSVPANATNVKVSFYYQAYSSSYPESFKVGYSTTDNNTESFTWSAEVTNITNTTFTTYPTATFPANTKYIAIAYTASDKYYLFIDDIDITCDITGPALNVYDGESGISSGHNYDFGLATAGTTKTFTLSNPGTEAAPITVTHTGSFGVSPTSASIPAGESITLTVTMPNATGNDEITISSSSDAIDDFTINVSGTVRDANKFFETFAGGTLPSEWNSAGGWTFSSDDGGYASQKTYSACRLMTPLLVFDGTENLYFEAAFYSNASYVQFTVQYSADGTNWTDATLSSNTFNSTWTGYTASGIPAGKYYIGFNCRYAYLRNIYGGELPNEPKMVVTQPASLDYGVITEATQKTFTIANTGRATLENISVTSSNNAVFTITNAPASLVAGDSQEVTITMAASTTGVSSAEIAINATGMEEVKFTVSGVVLPDGLFKEEFTDGLPANWTNSSWTFANGIATGKSSSAYLTTPKLIFSEGNLLVLKARRCDSDTSDYLTVEGSNDNGSTWKAYSKKLQNTDGLTYPDFGTIVLSDIPTTVNKIRFVGYYAEIDEIAGLTYAPVLTVTTGDPAETVSTPADYDFGECTANASVTYNFANTGAGTISITTVEITGTGAASYSTNWTTSVAAPFDLTITRTYDANNAPTAQDAVVTVTTTEGTFVINVTGTDRAANAPELLVSTNEINFGKVTADAVETVTVTNNGTGSMTVNIVSDSEDFLVSAAQLTEIGAGESKNFTVTFKYGTPYGVKNANITVTPTYDASAAQTITATVKAKDPATWSEDFAANELPTGWDAGANWTIADGVAKGTYAYGTTNYLTTPTLAVSGTTDELTFDYAATGNYVDIKIQMSKDGGDWTDCTPTPAISSLNTGATGSATITGLEAGNYQFRFKNEAYNLDNFEGFVLNLPEHMATITAYTIPESFSWTVTMKEGQSFDATVTVKEQRGVAEALTAKLYMGDAVIGTATGNVAAKGTETLTITATPTSAATDGAQMHIEVEWAGTTMTTENVTRYVSAITYLTLDETSSDAIVYGTYDHVTLKRKFNAGWNTVCLPFTISDVETFFGTGAKAYNFSSYNTTTGELSFTNVTTLDASYPYIVYVPAAITDDIELTDITIASGDATAFYRYQSTAYFRGTYAPVASGAWTKSTDSDIVYGVTSVGRIQRAGENASIKGFRAYFDLPESASAPILSIDGVSTGINMISGEGFTADDSAVYNLNGQRVQKAHKGLHIINGRKVVVK